MSGQSEQRPRLEILPEERASELGHRGGSMKPHIGLDGKPCQCTPAGLRRVKRDQPRTCRCHGLPHAKCPDARPCIGGCGRLTTASETIAPGYCPHCAADTRWRRIA
jgi:hypothetical protein